MVILLLSGLLNPPPHAKVAGGHRAGWRTGHKEPASPAERRASMTWAQRLKRVFNIDIETCQVCGGAMKVISCIEDPAVIRKILDHLKVKAEPNALTPWPEPRAPPVGLFG